MPIDVTARHMNARPEVYEHAWAEAQSLVDEFPNIEHVHVILDVQKRLKEAEIVVQAKKHLKIEGKDASESMIAAIDAAAEKVERQLRKQRDRQVEHR